MRLYIGVDDTDHIESDRGTGKLARWFEKEVPSGGRIWGVVRQQLLVHPDVPYTSHNSAACIVVDLPDGALVGEISRRIVAHVERHADEGSDPGVAFGLDCTRRVVTRKDDLRTAGKAFLRGLGGTNDGIIGALAAVGLTASGWSGRFIEFGRLRDFPDSVSVEDLARAHIHVVSMDRDARVPAETAWIRTNGWLRPRLFGSRAVLPVSPGEDGVWVASGGKRSRPHSP